MFVQKICTNGGIRPPRPAAGMTIREPDFSSRVNATTASTSNVLSCFEKGKQKIDDTIAETSPSSLPPPSVTMPPNYVYTSKACRVQIPTVDSTFTAFSKTALGNLSYTSAVDMSSSIPPVIGHRFSKFYGFTSHMFVHCCCFIKRFKLTDCAFYNINCHQQICQNILHLMVEILLKLTQIKDIRGNDSES